MYLPVEGVHGLPGAININHLFETQEILQKLGSGGKIMCSDAHKFFDLDTLVGGETAFPAPKKKPQCSIHPTIGASLYCNECSSSICQECFVEFHNDHHITTFPKQEKALLDGTYFSLLPEKTPSVLHWSGYFMRCRERGWGWFSVPVPFHVTTPVSKPVTG
jgi:hypothetical protein